MFISLHPNVYALDYTVDNVCVYALDNCRQRMCMF